MRRAGPSLALVPGNDLDATFYEPLTQALSSTGVALHVIPLPGWGGVPPLPAPGWPALLEAIERALDAIPSERGAPPVLAGHSLGAIAALLVAARRPDLAPRLLLLEPIIAPTRGLAAGLARAYLRDVVRGDRDRFSNGGPWFRRLAPPRGPRAEAAISRYLAVRRTSDPGTAAALFEGLPSLYPLPLARVLAPTWIVRGARSGPLPRLFQAILAARLPRARALVVPGAGHWLADGADGILARALQAALRRRL